MNGLAAAASAAGSLATGAPRLLAGLALNAVYAAVLYLAVRLLVSAAAWLRPLVEGLPRGRRAASRGGWGRGEIPPAVELILWAAVALRLVLPPGLTAPWSLRAFVTSFVGAGAGGAAGGELPFDPATLFGTLAGGGREAPGGMPAGAGGIPPWILALLGALLVAWGLGAAYSLVRFARARRRVRRRIASGRLLGRTGDAAERSLVAAVHRWRSVLGVRRPVALVAGSGAEPGAGSPCTVGLLRPVIWLPERLLTEGDGRFAEAAVAHEMVHVHGLDDLWVRLLAALRALYFFHPVAWWVSARIADVRERAVDDAVLGHGIVTPATYGRALLTTLVEPQPGEHSVNTAERALFPAFGSPQRSTPMRIHRIVRRHAGPTARPSRRAVTLAGLALAALVALAALPMAAAPQPAAGHGHDAHQAHQSHQRWASPVRHARVTSPFGERHDPLASDHPSQHHDGVDLGAPAGTPILAPAAGVVTVATEHYRPAPHWGTVVIVDHGDGVETRYAHLGTLGVAEGQKVARGDTLGTVGATGQVTGPHLHFEVLRDGEPVDPATLVADLTD